MVFPKKSCWNMIFLVLSGKMIFLFPENIILFFRRKMKGDISQNNTWKCNIFFKCSEKIVFPKKLHWNMIFLVVLSGKMIFLFPKIWSYSLDGKWKIIFLKKNSWKFDIFFKCHEKIIFPKKSRWNMIFLVLSGKDFSGKFDIFSLGGKWNIIFLKKYMEIWYFLYIYINVTNMISPFNLFSWRYSTMKNLQYSVLFSLQELYLEVCLSVN